LRLYLIDLMVVGPLTQLPKVKALLGDIKHIYTIEGLVCFVNLAQCNIFKVLLVTRGLVGQSLLDDLDELVVMLSEDKDSLESFLQ